MATNKHDVNIVDIENNVDNVSNVNNDEKVKSSSFLSPKKTKKKKLADENTEEHAVIVDTIKYGDIDVVYTKNESAYDDYKEEVAKQIGKIFMYTVIGLMLIIFVPLFVGFSRGLSGVDSSILDIHILQGIFDRVVNGR